MNKTRFKPFAEMHSLTVEGDSVSEEGIREVDTWLGNHHKPYLPNDFSNQWTLAGKTHPYTGTFPTRVKLWLIKEHQIKLTKEEISEIGNLARKNVVPAKKYWFDFVDRIEWSSGDFGDRGSCYWGDHRLAKAMLTDHGSVAIRLYDYPECECNCHASHHCQSCQNDHSECGCGCHNVNRFAWCIHCKMLSTKSQCPGCETYGEYLLVEGHNALCKKCTAHHAGCVCWCHQKEKPETQRVCCGRVHAREPELNGVARAWIVFPGKGDWKKNKTRLEKPFDACVLFNGYGYSLEIISQIVAKFLNLPYRQIRLYNNGSDSKMLYINNAKGILVGDAPEIDTVSLRWKEEDQDECTYCGEVIDSRAYRLEGGDILCESCYEDRGASCVRCGRYFYLEDTTVVDDSNYCEQCRDRLFFACDDCGEWFPRDDRVLVAANHLTGNRHVCDSCAKEYVTCDQCGNRIEKTDDGPFCSASCRARWEREHEAEPQPA